MKHFFIALLCITASCTKKVSPITAATKTPTDTLTYSTANTLTITGDFDGDGKQDILNQLLADSTGRPIDKVRDHETWEETVNYYSKQGYYTAVVINHKPADILTFSNSQGLYCLINVGDLNNDKRDEIALVPDSMDFSRHNYCHIYSFCPSGWKDVFSFSVHEDAFDYMGDTLPVFTNIPQALEYRNSEWYFYDYLDMQYKTEEDVGKMLPLIVAPCN